MTRHHKRLIQAEVPPLGSHLVTRRLAYTHHGIYIGERRVIHYAGLAEGLQSGPIEETYLHAFGGGRQMWVRLHPESPFCPEEIISRARSRISEKGYSLDANNCEHFAWWCVMGEHVSP